MSHECNWYDIVVMNVQVMKYTSFQMYCLVTNRL